MDSLPGLAERNSTSNDQAVADDREAARQLRLQLIEARRVARQRRYPMSPFVKPSGDCAACTGALVINATLSG